ncbi:uncharacterized protein TRUGW13939_09231 [Talaromyces rugulosus]|uniref:Uncharacterized protein n=1 Tax=Talaromyces rugulosus TaxID=121627 RepID=A0A7H8R914_TALRU|nr:uncharacterized protein TRUGW13939_09231 [Talaromyces rugulosus]QKX62075.1 hypothetical protein TRUGW13939_09231 [Talaromyces rugulosus]
MSAPSSLLFPAAMEDPFADTMEMASPFAGHVDDFEIDIDIMDDQPGNVDNDFDLQDASPANATGEALPDADMMDDVPEVAVTDTSHHETQPHMQSNDTFYPAQETYESEMADEEYEEDGDASIADTETLPVEIAPAENDPAGLVEPSKPAEDQTDTNLVNDSKTEEVGEQISTTAQESDVQREELYPQQPTGEDDEEEKEEERNLEGQPDTKNDVAETEQVNADITTDEKEAESHSPDHPDNIADATEQDHLTDQPHEAALEPSEEKQASDVKDTSAILHSVKVLYQGSEISMFPPREGDASETYFLQDEGLAYETVDHLFKECRTILGEHASDSDSLVFDIDSLGIQLSEDNIFNPKVTLSQLVDVYVHLCRNEGVEKPEPLYLTLTTRPNLSTELSTLLNTAAEGKGISEIQTWEEEYEQEDAENAEDPDHPLPSESHVEKHEDVEHDDQVHIEAEASSASIRQPDDENDGQYREEEEEGENEDVDVALPNQRVPTNSELTGLEENSKAEADALESGAAEYESVAPEGHSNTQYDFERHSDSSETLTQAPLVQSEDQQPEDSASHQQVYDDVDHTRFEDYENEGLTFGGEAAENTGQDIRENDEADPDEDLRSNAVEVNNTDATGEVDDQENAATEVYEGYTGEDNFEEDAGEEENHQEVDEEYYEDEEYYAEEHQGTNNESGIQPGQVDGQDVPVEPSEAEPSSLDALGEDDGLPDDSLGASETRETEIEAHDKSTGLTAELTDDLLGLEEDIFAEAEDPGQPAKDEHPSGNGQDDAHENDIDVIDFEAFDEAGETEVATDGGSANTPLQRQNSSTGKRSRGPEDEESESVETSTPDAKRSRSS